MIITLIRLSVKRVIDIKSLKQLKTLLDDNQNENQIKITNDILVKYKFTSRKQLYDTIYLANLHVLKHLPGLDIKLVWDNDFLRINNNFNTIHGAWSDNIYNFSIALEASLHEESRMSYDRRLMRIKDWALISVSLIPIIRVLLLHYLQP